MAENGSTKFLLGTDDLGRDILSRIVSGAQISMGIGFFVVAFSLFGGMVLGLLAGTSPIWVDQFIMRFMDIVLSLPSVLLAVLWLHC